MVDHTDPRPLLLCAGSDPDRARTLARRTADIVKPRRAIVLAVEDRPPHWLLRGAVSALEVLVDGLDPESVREQAHEHATMTARAACEEFEEQGWDVTAVVSGEDRRPWEVALAVAEREDAAVLVAGTSDHDGDRPGSLGSEVRALAHRGRRPLLAVPTTSWATAADGTAFVAYDGSPHAVAAIEAATNLLAPRRAIVATAWRSVLAAAPAGAMAIPGGLAAAGAERHDQGLERAAAETAAPAAELLRAAGWQAFPRPVEASTGIAGGLAAAAAAEDAAIVIAGTRGRSRVAAALLGSVAEGLLRHSGRPVLVTPHGNA